MKVARWNLIAYFLKQLRFLMKRSRVMYVVWIVSAVQKWSNYVPLVMITTDENTYST